MSADRARAGPPRPRSDAARALLGGTDISAPEPPMDTLLTLAARTLDVTVVTLIFALVG